MVLHMPIKTWEDVMSLYLILIRSSLLFITMMVYINKYIILNEQLKKFEEALELFNKALSLIPNDIKTLYSKGVSSYRLQRYSEALEIFESIVKLDPNYSRAWSGIGSAYY